MSPIARATLLEIGLPISEGFTISEIAKALGINERFARQLVKQTQTELLRLANEPERPESGSDRRSGR